MANYDYDLFVIGGGSGGVRAGRISASFGARVALAEDYRLGGTCVIRGCVPKKLLVYASHYSEDIESAAGFGWQIEGARFDWQTLIANKDQEIARLEGLYRQTLENAGVTIYEARATVEDPHTVNVGGETVTAETILVATGGWPNMPDIPGIEHAITSNEAFHLEEFPKRVMVCGGGYIAVEFAGIFNGMGAEVTQVYRRDLVLRGFDEDLRKHAMAEMEKKGVKFVLNAVAERIDKEADGLHVRLNDGSTHVVDQIMFAIGRRPNTAGLGLETAGVELAENGAVCVDSYSKSTVDSIYAVGDVTDRINLTPVAIKEGHAFALTKYNGTPTSPDHRYVASAVFTQPPIGTVGYTEEEAIEELGTVDVYVSDFRPLKHTLGGGEERAFAKLVVNRSNGHVVGAHMIGVDAPEIVQGMAIAIKMGATKDQFDATVGIHPSSAEEFVQMAAKRA